MTEKNNNKIKFGLSNVHYALIEESGEFGKPKRIPGGVTLSTSPEGDSNPFYADDTVYYNSQSNNGYTGDLEVAILTDEFKVDVLGYEKDEVTGLLIENSDAISKEFALLYEIKGDSKKRRNVFYKVSAGRPGEENNTKAESADPSTDTLPITIMPMELGGKFRVKASAYEDDAIYDSFYKEVPIPGKGPEA